MKRRNLILILALNLTYLIAYSQNNDSLVTSIIDTTKSGYIIEFDTVEVFIKVTEVISGEEILLTKKDKIRVYITGGSNMSGRWEIIDENNIRVNELTVPISVIENIKNRKMSKGGKTALALSLIAGVAILIAVVVATATFPVTL